MGHEDKNGTPIAQHDLVELVYGGDHHIARVINHSRNLDVDHLELQLVTNVSVPAASVALYHRHEPKQQVKEQPEEQEVVPITPKSTKRPTHSTTRKGAQHRAR